MALMSIEEAIHAFYKDRLSNDPTLLHSWLTENGRMRIVGVADNPGIQDARDQYAPLYLEKLAREWLWRDAEILSILADGNEAACRVRFQVESVATGERVWTELSSHTVFDGQRFSSIVTYLDTWLMVDLSKSANTSEAVA